MNVARNVYKSKRNWHAVETSDRTRKLVNRIHVSTKIPRRHIVDMALLEYLPKKYADELAQTEQTKETHREE
jgi:hypothetical protein